MKLSEYMRGQVQEACSETNKWYCSQYFGYEVRDPKTLVEYYIKHGGTQSFAQRHQRELECADGTER